LLVLLCVPGIGKTINGSRRWFGFFGLSFQPSECVKIFLPMAYIHWFMSRKSRIHFKVFLKILGCLFVPIGLILIQPDHGTTLILLSLLTVLFFLTRIRFFYWALPLAILVSVGACTAYQLPYVKSRIQVYLHPELELRG